MILASEGKDKVVGLQPVLYVDGGILRPSYDYTGNDAFSWRRTADDLLMGARILDRLYHQSIPVRVRDGKVIQGYMPLFAPSRLLYAVAIETLLKARAVKRGHKFVVANKFRPINGTERDPHNLVLLAKATGYRLSRKSKFLLDRLSYATEMARYPIAKNAYRYAPDKGLSATSLSNWYSSDAAALRGLVKRLRADAR